MLSWVARNNDPFERNRDGSYRLDEKGERVPGPTLNLLFDKASPYREQVSHVVLLMRIPPGISKKEQEKERQIVQDTITEVQHRADGIQVETRFWPGSSPIDHQGIFAFLKARVPEIRRLFPNQELLINVSPGTPAMHTVWVLMAETGYVEPPFTVVQTIPAKHRQPGEPAAVPVDLGIETFYKAYRVARPQHDAGEEERVFWDPARFQSAALRRVFTEARRFAGLKVPVLILGERGTGKTTLASWIRTHSPFRHKDLDASWPSVPCGQYSAETMRAELFGYKKGSFTGATKDHDGLLAVAHGDTLFLDEIGDISPDLQRLLIRAVEEGTYTPLGSTEVKESDFRLITATNRRWEKLEGQLDLDFLDRISALVLRMPALREIPEDLDWIWASVYQQAVQRAGGVPEDDLLEEDDHTRISEHLHRQALPGNLRDLFRVAYRLVAALADPLTPLMPDEAISYALEAGLRALPASVGTRDLPHKVMQAFLQDDPLDAIVDAHDALATKDVEAALKQYLGREIRSLARRRGVKPETFCDVKDRTLLNWENASGNAET